MQKRNTICIGYYSTLTNQKGNQNPYIEEEQTTQWQKEKVQKGKQRSTKQHIKLKIELHEPH
jgi:hypothetical protein